MLDVAVPGVDGFAVLAAVKGDPRTAATAVVMFSAVLDAGSRRRAARLGAEGYFPKGETSVADLSAAVARHARVGPPAPPSGPRPPAAAESPPLPAGKRAAPRVAARGRYRVLVGRELRQQVE